MSKVWTLSLNLGSFYFPSGNPSYIVTTALDSSNCSLPSYPFMKFLSNYPNRNKLFAFYKDCEVGFWHQISCVFEKCRQNLRKGKGGKGRPTTQAKGDISYSSCHQWWHEMKYRWKGRCWEVKKSRHFITMVMAVIINIIKSLASSRSPRRCINGKMRNWNLRLYNREHKWIREKFLIATHLLQYSNHSSFRVTGQTWLKNKPRAIL